MMCRKNKSPLKNYVSGITLSTKSVGFLLCMFVSLGVMAEEVNGATGGGAEYSTGLNYNGYDQHSVGVEPTIGPSTKLPTLGVKERGRVFEFWFLKKRSNAEGQIGKNNQAEQSEGLKRDAD